MDNQNENIHEIEINQIKETLSFYSVLIQGEHDAYSNKKLKMQFPILPLSALTYLVEESINIFSKEPTMLEISSPICVVGDIHGQIIDLFRILKFCGQPPKLRFLFLGDFIDRGHFSLETLILVYSLKFLYPSKIFILRGNHEFECDDIVDHSTFCSEIESIYGNCSIYELFLKSFTFLPLAAKVDNFFLCLHGGISEDFISIDQIRSIERPLTDFRKGVVQAILWSDPTDNRTVDFKDSPRGYGRIFGLSSIKNFLDDNDLRFLVRGHQCKSRGFESSCDGYVLTVFSASNYFGVEENRSAVLFIQSKGIYKTKTFPPFNEIRREDASFLSMEEYRSVRNRVTSSRSTKDHLKLIQRKSEIEKFRKSPKIPSNVSKQTMRSTNNHQQNQLNIHSKPNTPVEKRKPSSCQEKNSDSSISLLNGTRRKVPTVINPSNASKQTNQRGNFRNPSSSRKVRYHGIGSRNLFS